jgi:carbamoyltransferase
MQSTMNLKIKFRESFRPFAPSVLEEKAGAYFDLDGPSPYMLLVARVRDDKISPDARRDDRRGLDRLKVPRSVIPAVTHVDFSARVQTVSAETNPVFHRILAEFEKLTGCPVLINTSFNIRGEPIVCTPRDAYRCFMGTEMDHLVMGPFLLNKQDQPDREKYHKESITQILD